MTDTVQFFKAQADELPLLRTIAHRSEAHWGYSRSFMEIFDRKFNITEAFLRDHPVYSGKLQEATVGFWGMQNLGTDHPELEYFYIAPEYLGQGYGKVMWQDLTGWCREEGILSFEFVTSPQAVGFYEKMGAAVTGERRSSIDGRRIPFLEYRLGDERIGHHGIS